MQLVALDTAFEIADMTIPGYRLHPSKGLRLIAGQFQLIKAGDLLLSFEMEMSTYWITRTITNESKRINV